MSAGGALATELRKLAVRAAHAGAAVARDFRRRPLDVQLKADLSEVSAADLAAQQAVSDVILAARPRDQILGEEFLEPTGVATSPPDASAPPGAQIWWIIDPIDGTRNYVRGLPCFATAVAALWEGVPIAAATVDLALNATFSADPTTLFLDDAPLTESAREIARGRSARPLVATPSSVDGLAAALLEQWRGRCLLRNFGAACLHLAYVGAGRLDAALASDCRLWDIAGGWLLVRAAGGVMTRLDGAAIFPLDVATYDRSPIACLASRDAALHAELLGA